MHGRTRPVAVPSLRLPGGRLAAVRATAPPPPVSGVPQPFPATAFRLLGPLEVLVQNRPVRISNGRQRALLATLLLRANETVSMRELGHSLWGDRPPANPNATIQKYVMRMRRQLEPAECVIHTESDGYRLAVDPNRLDLHRFDELAAQGLRAVDSGRWSDASTLLAEAIGLWRAVPPLADVRSERVTHDDVPRMVERYLHVVESRIEADLQLGRHSALGAELLGLVRHHPLRERFWEQRMRALYATQRRGEALAAYREIARLLADELGVDPGPALQQTHQRMLAGVAPSPAAEASDRRGGLGLRQLPMAASGVVGRSAEIDQIVRVLGPLRREHRPRLVVVHGPEGVGKSTVAIHAAHRLSEEFPDGQLYADFPEEYQSQERVAEVLVSFSRALGVPSESVPVRLEDASAAFRSTTADRRVLVVLDGMPMGSTVRALLPGSAGCGVIVSSRHDLADLFVHPGAHGILLEPLRRDVARRALCELVGAERVDAESEAADQLVQLCNGLPLMVRAAAAHLATHPRLSIASCLERFRSGEIGPDVNGRSRLCSIACT
ncbi:BTAD domain-containing putative transcriptional regulator [Actinomycetes bacterium KLBMP 9759]